MTELGVLVVGALVGFVALWLAVDRARTLVVCEVHRGKVRIVRGRLAAAPLAEIVDVVARKRLVSGTIVVRKEAGAPAVRVKGIDDEAAVQQLRNAIGRFRLAQLRA